MRQNGVGAGVIEVRIRELSQLFNSLDPSPFHERDLDDDAEAHIVGWAREIPDGVPFQIIVRLPQPQAEQARSMQLETALRNFFTARVEAADRDLRELMRSGRQYLSIGLPILLVCLLASQAMRGTIGDGPFARLIEESLIIIGWVANWKPLETFLYDRLPLIRRCRLYRRLAAATVEIVPDRGDLP
jgi:hypothetical protein